MEPSWAHGSIPGKSTEGAVLVNLSAAWRLRQVKRDHITSNYDATNAFGSYHWPALLEGIGDLTTPTEIDLHNEQLAQQSFELAADNKVVTFRPGCGVLMGKSGGPPIFVHTYNTTLSEWNKEQLKKYPATTDLFTRDPVSNRMADLSLTVYVDDISKTHIADPTHRKRVLRVAKRAEKSLTSKLEDKGVKLNSKKTEYLIGCYGGGAMARRARLRRHLPTAKREVRYLGPVFGRTGALGTETHRRMLAGKVAFQSVG